MRGEGSSAFFSSTWEVSANRTHLRTVGQDICPSFPDIARRRLIRICRPSSAGLHRTFVNDHPGSTELVPEYAEAVSKERLLHGHEDFTAVGGRHESAPPLVCCRGLAKGSAAHRLEAFRRNITLWLSVSDGYAGIKDGLLPIRRHVVGSRHFAMGHHHRDTCAEMLS